MNRTESRFQAEGATDVGRVRKNNEDWWAKGVVRSGSERYHLWVLADGMGGGAKGEVASQLAVETLVNYLAEGAWHDQSDALREGFNRANMAVFDRVTGGGEATRSAMGTTLVAALVAEATGKYWVANTGDSRAYLWRNGQLVQISEDHSLVAERVRAGELTAEAARVADERNVITRAIGLEAVTQVDVFEPGELQPGERILLCSDGVHGMLPDQAIAAAIGSGSLDAAAQQLVDDSNNAGGHDNTTAVVGGFTEQPPTPWDATIVERLVPATKRDVTPLAATLGAVAAVGLVFVVFALVRHQLPWQTSKPPAAAVISQTSVASSGTVSARSKSSPVATPSIPATSIPSPSPGAATDDSGVLGCPAGQRVVISANGFQYISDIAAVCGHAFFPEGTTPTGFQDDLCLAIGGLNPDALYDNCKIANNVTSVVLPSIFWFWAWVPP